MSEDKNTNVKYDLLEETNWTKANGESTFEIILIRDFHWKVSNHLVGLFGSKFVSDNCD